MAIYNEIFQLVDISVENYIETTSLSVISYITPIFTSLFILTIVIWGYLLMMGRSQAHKKTIERHQNKFKVVKVTNEVKDTISDLLTKDWSPEQVSGWLKKEDSMS